MFYLNKLKVNSLVRFFGVETVNCIIIGLLYYALFYYLHGGWKLLVFVAVVLVQDSDLFEGLSVGSLDDDDFNLSSEYSFVNFLSLVLVLVILFAYLALAFISLYQGFIGLGVLKVTIY